MCGIIRLCPIEKVTGEELPAESPRFHSTQEELMTQKDSPALKLSITAMVLFFLDFAGETPWGAMAFAQESAEVQLTDDTKLSFVPASEAADLVGRNDEFIQRMQPLERQLRLRSASAASQDEYLEHLKSCVQDWSSEEIDRVSMVAEALRESVQAYDLPWPPKIKLVRASADMEENAPHCRREAIVLPDGFFGSEPKMTKVLAHELFHVLSSHNRELRSRLYSIIGFKPTEQIFLPEGLSSRRLTNPDAPVYEHYLEISHEGKPLNVTPVTMTRSAEYREGGLFANLDFQLLVLSNENPSQPLVEDGHAKLIKISEAPAFLDKIGRNTGYIIHPEEIMADNFSLLILGQRNVPDAWILEQMKDILTKQKP